MPEFLPGFRFNFPSPDGKHTGVSLLRMIELKYTSYPISSNIFFNSFDQENKTWKSAVVFELMSRFFIQMSKKL